MIHNLLPYRMRNRALHYMSARVVLFGVLLMLVMIFDGLILRAVDQSFDFSFQVLRAEIYEQVKNPGSAALKARAVRVERLVSGYRSYAPVLRDVSAILPPGTVIEDLALDTESSELVLQGHVSGIGIVGEMEALFDASESVLSNETVLSDLQPDGSAGFTATLRIEPRSL